MRDGEDCRADEVVIDEARDFFNREDEEEGPQIPAILLALRQTRIYVNRATHQKAIDCPTCRGTGIMMVASFQYPEGRPMLCYYCCMSGRVMVDCDASGREVKMPNAG